jgi:hypothetical protein
MDLEMNDMMYDIHDTPEPPISAPEETAGGDVDNDDDDDYENSVLENPMLLEQPILQPLADTRHLIETPLTTPAKRRVTTNRKTKRRKTDEDDGESQGFVEEQVTVSGWLPKRWIKGLEFRARFLKQNSGTGEV